MLRVAVSSDWADATAWDTLVSADTLATPFQTRAWSTTWWKHFAGGKTLFVLQAYEGDDLVGLYPLFFQKGVWGALRPVGVGPSDYLRILAQPELRQDVEDLFLNTLRESKALVDLHQFPTETPPARAITQASCLVVDLPESYEAYLSRLSKSLRYDVRRLDKDPSLQVVKEDDPARALAILFDLHEKRWRSRGLPGAFMGRTKRFHEEWAAQAQRNGTLRLSVLEWNGRPVGAIYAMSMGGRCYYYQAGFEPTAASISPGTVLVAHTLRIAIEEGDTEFDFCRGDEPYKRRWKPDRVVTNYRILMADSALGRVGEGWNRMAWRVEERVRQRLEGGRLLPKWGSKSPRRQEPSANSEQR